MCQYCWMLDKMRDENKLCANMVQRLQWRVTNSINNNSAQMWLVFAQLCSSKQTQKHRKFEILLEADDYWRHRSIQLLSFSTHQIKRRIKTTTITTQMTKSKIPCTQPHIYAEVHTENIKKITKLQKFDTLAT